MSESLAVVKLLEPDVLRATSENNKSKIDGLVVAFEETNPEHASRFASVIKRVKEAAETAGELDLSLL